VTTALRALCLVGAVTLVEKCVRKIIRTPLHYLPAGAAEYNFKF
jgi:hypothetical protein